MTKKAKLLLNSISIIGVLLMLVVACKKNESSDVLEVTPDLVEIDGAGGNGAITIASVGDWSLKKSADWFSVSVISGIGNSRVTVSADVNPDSISRTGTLTISTKNLSKQISIFQEGYIPSFNDTTPDPDTVPVFSYEIPPDNTGMRDLTSLEISQEMLLGWNIGNSLEAIGGETAWGNPLITKNLIDSVKAAGFNAIRIPIAWSKFSNASEFTITDSWMNRVEEVVSYVLDNDMYAIVNIHWDDGWMVPTYSKEVYVNKRLAVMWRQIATHFRDYNDHLLFAGTNEVHIKDDYNAPTKEYYTVQNGFNQTFVTTVRATGGRNAYRHLVVQGFNTNINFTISYALMPADCVANRLLMEVHYYDPYEFALEEDTTVTQWGAIATDPSKKVTWGDESYVQTQMAKMKTKYINKGIGVIIGEYGATAKQEVSDNIIYREYYLKTVTQVIVNNNLVPFYWDNGHTGDYGFGLFNRNNGEQVYPNLIKSLNNAVGN